MIARLVNSIIKYIDQIWIQSLLVEQALAFLQEEHHSKLIYFSGVIILPSLFSFTLSSASFDSFSFI